MRQEVKTKSATLQNEKIELAKIQIQLPLLDKPIKELKKLREKRRKLKKEKKHSQVRHRFLSSFMMSIASSLY
jgi:hypothetical protein